MANRRHFVGQMLAGALEGMGRYGVEQGKLREADRRQQQGADLTTQRELLMKVMEEVRKGETDPQAGEETLRKAGVPLTTGMFDSIAPSTSTRLSGVLKGIGAAGSIDQVPSPTAIGTEMKAKRVPLITPSHIDPTTYKSSGGDLTPELLAALGERSSKLDAFPAHQVATYDPQLGTDVASFIPAREMGQARTLQTKPTPTQAATNTATEQGTLARLRDTMGIAKQEGANVGTSDLEKALKGTFSPEYTAADIAAENAKISGTSAARARSAAQSAGASTAASTQAGIDVTTAPANVGKQAFKESYIRTYVDKAVQDLKDAGVPPQMAESFIHIGPETKTPYVYLDPGVPTEIKNAVYKKLGQPVAQGGMAGVRFVSKDQNDALGQVAAASDTIDQMLDDFQKFAPKSPEGRLIAGPANTFARILQTHPELGSVATYFGPKVEIFRALTAGVRGFRMTQWELQENEKGQIQPTDTWPVMVKKAAIMHNVFESIEKRIVSGNPSGTGAR